MAEAHDMGSHAPFERVLVATDFSHHAQQALRRVFLLPLAPRARIHVLHVIGPAPRGAPANDDVSAEKALAGVVQFARECASASGCTGIEVSSGLASGRPFSEIIRCSRTISAELVVLGRHGGRGFQDRFLGSTAERVFRKGDVPTLIVALDAVHRYQRPVVAVDIDDASVRTLDLARRVVGAGGAEGIVLYAYTVPFKTYLGEGTSEVAQDFRKHYRDAAEHSLARLLASRGDEATQWTPVVRDGESSSSILEEVLQRLADIVVIGTHGRAGVANMLRGSVAKWVVRNVPCDVLISSPVRFSFAPP